MTHKAQSSRAVSIVGTGSYLPEKILTNQDLAAMVETSDEWIKTRTGISERRIAAPEQATSDMGAEAARRALADAKVAPGDVDAIITATITPDMPFPSTACFIQNLIGAGKAFCFDICAACSGFIYGLETGRQYVANGAAETVLVIASEKLSAVTDWEDRSTCVLFGDGAGAAVLQSKPGERGIISSFMGSDGGLSHLLNLPAGGSRMPASEQTLRDRMHYLKMAGREVFKYAVNSMLCAANHALERSGVEIQDIACIIPHQANMRIIQAIASRLEMPIERFFINLNRYGNMSAASVAVALDEALKTGAAKKGDKVMLLAFGGGFTWAASIVEI